jgi:hypothetical protein
VRHLLVTLALLLAACGGEGAGSAVPPGTGPLVDASGSVIPEPPAWADGPLDPSVAADLDLVFEDIGAGVDIEALTRVGRSGDVRVAWLLTDLLRFFPTGPVAAAAGGAFEALTGAAVGDLFAWGPATNLLMAWDVPAPPGYVDWKHRAFALVEPDWEPFFTDEDAAIDWRLISWGGVVMDDRSVADARLGAACEGNCIPALDDPGLTDAAGGDWYLDGRYVFGVIVNGEARAYPKNLMEVHEMVNDTLGGRRIGVAYCTLCGSAQAYFTDTRAEPLELRTSGLLNRSNKVMFDFSTRSAFDTFTGVAVSGPLQDEGFSLEMATVVTATWGEWKSAHPETTIVAEDGGIGRTYPLDPLGSRDFNGPIFPVGAVDPRLPVHFQVLGVAPPDGAEIAFPVEAAKVALGAGRSVELGGVRVVTDGSGLRAETLDGEPLVTHQAFWFAWSQFNPDTLVWTAFGS